MSSRRGGAGGPGGSASGLDRIGRITVRGFKSLAREQAVEIRPLTILAGANSSGKSSVMQPLLLMKQTLEAGYDPGALLLDGPNVRFNSAAQLFARSGPSKKADAFRVGFEIEGEGEILSEFQSHSTYGLDLAGTKITRRNGVLELTRSKLKKDEFEILGYDKLNNSKNINFRVARDRCFLKVIFDVEDGVGLLDAAFESAMIRQMNHLGLIGLAKKCLESIVHLPGLRGNPARTYPVTAVGSNFPGTFENYTASVINRWEEEKRSEEIARLSRDLRDLGLTWKVGAKKINDTQVELQVGRLPVPARGGSRDMISIADVGLGLSQTLPVLVALHAAAPGQMVYLEQPEIHLHPRAQTTMARVLARAARRGVRVVVETHSDLLLLGIQTEVARGDLPREDVKLHWFQRIKDGTTQVTSADLDGSGTFGDWPEDFAEVRLKAESEFLDASLDLTGTH